MPTVNQINAARQQDADARVQVDAELLNADPQLRAPPPRPNQPLPPENSTAMVRRFSEAFGEDDKATSAATPPSVIDSRVGQRVNAVATDGPIQRVITDAHVRVQVAAPTNPMRRQAAASRQRRRQRRRRSH